MPSSQSFAVCLPLCLLGTMAIVAVFLPIGCLAGGGDRIVDELISGKTLGHGLSYNLFPNPPVVASPKQAGWRMLLPDMSNTDRALAGMIEAKYSMEMKVPIKGLDTNENVKTAVEMMMSMPVGNRNFQDVER